MQFTIRDATREDGPELLALVRGLNQHQSDPVEHFDAEILERDVFGQDAYLGTLVAEHDGALVGYAFSTTPTRAAMRSADSIFAISMSLRRRAGAALDAHWSPPSPTAQPSAAARFCGGRPAPGTRRRGGSTLRWAPAKKRSRPTP